MDLLNLLLIGVTTFVILLSFFYIHHSKKSSSSCSGGSAPQAGGALPIIGHIHLFDSRKLTHEVLGAMADEYGPAFTIKLGPKPALVISTWEMAKECSTVHDRVFAEKPLIAASRILGYEGAMFGFAPYGPYWREMRKIAMIELLSNKGIDMIKHIRVSEVETAILELHEGWVNRRDSGGVGLVVEMKQWFGNVSLNIAVRMVTGKRYLGQNADCGEGEAHRCKELVKDSQRLFGVFVLSDVVPSLWWLDFQGYLKTMRRIAKDMDNLAAQWLEEHKHKHKRVSGGKDRKEQDLMDAMLNIQENTVIPGFSPDTISKATCLNFVVAATDTVTVTLTWALSLLLNNPETLKKVQEELDIHVGKERRVEESELNNLVYLQAVVKETLRLYPAAPVIGLRESMEDCTLSTGYRIPAGTRLILNLWKIHRDERVWPEPDQFQPERFLTSHKDVDVRGQNFELIPFGSGRRVCPGISLALRLVHFALARLLHSFEVAMPLNVKAVDMTGSIGLTNVKATPLEVVLIPRLSSQLYGG